MIVDARHRLARDERAGGVLVASGRGLRNLLADRCAGDAQETARAVIRLHEDADSVATEARVDLARGGPAAALEAVADHAGAAADVAFGDAARSRGVERREDVLRLHVEAVDVVEKAVPRFGDDRQRPLLRRAAMIPRPFDRRVTHDADAVRVRDE